MTVQSAWIPRAGVARVRLVFLDPERAQQLFGEGRASAARPATRPPPVATLRRDIVRDTTRMNPYEQWLTLGYSIR
jgi:hypothetical protein